MMKLRESSWRHLVLLPLATIWFLFSHPYTEPPWVLAAGAVLFVVGESLRIWATGYLQKDEVLTIGGPYLYVRNPMYVGTLLIGVGLLAAGGDRILLGVFLAIFFLYYIPRKERREGRRLLKKFGMDYAQYVVSVSPLVPRLKPYEVSEPARFSFRQVVKNNEHQAALSLLIAVALLVLKLVWSGPWVAQPGSFLGHL
jgi:protein-S-isoprenylcysteine O-methyltransferase Ste14